jgi:hypothetical protein
MKHVLLSILVMVLVLLFTTADVVAWGYKEHIQLTRLAAHRLIQDPATPDGLRAWLKQHCATLPDLTAERDWFMHERVGENPAAYRELLWWACVPDLQVKLMPRDQKLPYLPAHERLMHYIDMEMFLPAGVEQKYRDDLTARAPVESFVRDPNDPRYVQAGFLPFAVEHSYQQLVNAFKDGRMGTSFADPQNDDHAVKWAGYLAHYVQDNTQPHHATEDFRSWSYFPNLVTKPNIHSEFEWRMNDDAAQPFTALRASYWPLLELALRGVENPSVQGDLFVETLEVAGRSYEALPLIGHAAQHAHKTGSFDLDAFFRFQGKVGEQPLTVLQLKARQQAWAVVRTEYVLRGAWRDAKGE